MSTSTGKKSALSRHQLNSNASMTMTSAENIESGGALTQRTGLGNGPKTIVPMERPGSSCPMTMPARRPIDGTKKDWPAFLIATTICLALATSGTARPILKERLFG